MKAVTTSKQKKKMGRPSKFSKKIVQEICLRIMMGESVKSIVRNNKNFPSESVIYLWLSQGEKNIDKKKRYFLEQYERARQIQAGRWAEEILDIADNSKNDYITRGKEAGVYIPVLNKENIQRDRLRIDTRKWVISRILPKKYTGQSLLEKNEFADWTDQKIDEKTKEFECGVK